ncbi:MAG: hypothetical protein M3R02_19065 [Chloroflexota bacterium]|nr:hypothetical protein [Chloroflexota bacterium]
MTLLADELRAGPVDLTVDLFFLRTICIHRNRDEAEEIISAMTMTATALIN